MPYACPYCPAVATRTGKLHKHLRERRLYGGHQIPPAEATLIMESIGVGVGGAQVNALPAAHSALLQRGHWRSLELLENTEAVRETLATYEKAVDHPVYLRPTRKGLTVMSLDPATPSMVGIGGTSDCCINVLPPVATAVEGAVHAYRAKVAAMKRRSVEERYVIGRIRAALGNGLELGDDLLFLHQEWRLSSSTKIDILALDRHKGQLVVVEAKWSEAAALDPASAEQAAHYVEQLAAHAAECLPYFQRLATALARVYRPGKGELRVNLNPLPRWEIWWPTGHKGQAS